MIRGRGVEAQPDEAAHGERIGRAPGDAPHRVEPREVAEQQHPEVPSRQQARASTPDERKTLIRQFEKRLLDEEAHYILTLQWHRIVPHSAKVKGWQITPSHYLNNQLDTVWLAE